jgi:hypothetical protein
MEKVEKGLPLSEKEQEAWQDLQRTIANWKNERDLQ